MVTGTSEEEPGVRERKTGRAGGRGRIARNTERLRAGIRNLFQAPTPLGHSSLQTLNPCSSCRLPPSPSQQLRRARLTTASPPASPRLHAPSATPMSKHNHANRPAPSPTKPQHQAGGNRPSLLAKAAGSPSATQPRARRPSRRWDAGGMDRAHGCLHKTRAMGSMDRAGHAVEMRWVARVGDGEKKALSYQLTLRKQG